ncbi:hypothetical protein HBA91_18495, partial [Ochrobactrum sp. MR34]|nr:hypothetical protein [Ochrobactrum sp. MR34]
HSLAGEGALTIENPAIAGLNITAMPEMLRQSDELTGSGKAPLEPKQAEAERTKLSHALTQGGQMNANPVQAPLSLAGGILRAPSV